MFPYLSSTFSYFFLFFLIFYLIFFSGYVILFLSTCRRDIMSKSLTQLAIEVKHSNMDAEQAHDEFRRHLAWKESMKAMDDPGATDLLSQDERQTVRDLRRHTERCLTCGYVNGADLFLCSACQDEWDDTEKILDSTRQSSDADLKDLPDGATGAATNRDGQEENRRPLSWGEITLADKLQSVGAELSDLPDGGKGEATKALAREYEEAATKEDIDWKARTLISHLSKSGANVPAPLHTIIEHRAVEIVNGTIEDDKALSKMYNNAVKSVFNLDSMYFLMSNPLSSALAQYWDIQSGLTLDSKKAEKYGDVNIVTGGFLAEYIPCIIYLISSILEYPGIKIPSNLLTPYRTKEQRPN
jgi:hypothetical protein